MFDMWEKLAGEIEWEEKNKDGEPYWHTMFTWQETMWTKPYRTR